MGTENSITKLENHARSVRRRIVRMIHDSGTAGHYGGSLSCVEILSCLYFGWMRHRPKDPEWDGRDRLVLSKGHAAPALYAVLAEAGYFPVEQLGSFKRFGGILQGHPDMKLTPGVDMSTGSLGQGLSVALGMALAGKLDEKNYRVYALLGDGELDEGSVWEAAMAASHYRVDNLTVFVDRNNLQVSGPTESFMRLEPLKKKWEAFGWEVIEVDGHRPRQILQALGTMDRVSGRPGLIIARTVKGKGIRFLENKKECHSCTLTEEQFAAVMRELESR
jgi:transketolase